MTKTRYMIAHGASVGLVREGKRVTINAGGGDDFSEDEIRAVNAAVPGALRAPINESRKVTVEDDAGDDEGRPSVNDAPIKKATPKTAAKLKAADVKAAKAADKANAEDADEDEDI